MKALVGDFVVEKQVPDLENVAMARSTFGAFLDSDVSDEKFVELIKALE